MQSLARQQADSEFTAQLTRLQARLRGFLLAVTGSAFDADEVLQDTNKVLWQKRGTFEAGSNFQAWAFRIATFEARNFVRRRARTQGAELPSEELLVRIGDEAERQVDLQREGQHAALTVCLSKLRQDDRTLLVRRYFENHSLSTLAEERSSTQNALAQKLFRLRTAVLKCIEKQLQRDGGSP
jgi:RNA polymerase sigma-70 factor, ECF subfamily